MKTAVQRFGPQLAWVSYDLLCFAVAAVVSCWLLQRQPDGAGLAIIGVIALIRVWFFVQSGMYRAVLRFSGIHSLVMLSTGVVLGSVVGTFAGFFAFLEDIGGLGRRFLVIEGMASLALCGGTRFAVRYWAESSLRRGGEKVLVLGAGDTGEQVLRALRRSLTYRPVGLLDDDRAKKGALIHGVRVRGGSADLESVVRSTGASRVVVAAQLPPALLRELFRRAMELEVRLTVASNLGQAIDGLGEPQLEDIALDDLMRRPRRELDSQPVAALVAGKRVLVTGAGGSIGSDLARQVARFGPQRMMLLDHSEAALYQVDRALRSLDLVEEVVPALVNLADREALDRAFEGFRPEVVFHAAAYKHVPMLEANPYVGVRNNVLGFRNLAAACGAQGVERLVLVSTDKAVRPTNVMGASKRVCELLMRAAAVESGLRCCAVRFGNVLGSSGSVVPLFLDQIARGGPVTVTDREVTRFFMLIPEAVELVLQAAALGEPGDIFLLDMGEPVRIDHLARQLIYMTGRVPERDVAIEYTGLRPGEKRYEELLLTGTESETPVAGLLRARETQPVPEDVRDLVETLLRACRDHDPAGFLSSLRALVPEWTPDALWAGRLAELGAAMQAEGERGLPATGGGAPSPR